MSHHAKILALGLVVGLLALTGCSGSATPTTDANAVYTQAAGTVQAELTRIAAQTPSATPTAAPTDTPEATQAPTAAEATTPTSGDALATSAATQVPVVVATATRAAFADHGQWLSQTPGDGTTFAPGETFTMTWKIKNVGTSTWTTQYQLRFYAGDQMGGAATSAFPKEVKPDDTVELTVSMKAPSSPGKYLGNWVLTNTDGANFCPITIQISVANAPTATNAPPTNTPAPTAAPTATSGAVPSATP